MSVSKYRKLSLADKSLREDLFLRRNESSNYMLEGLKLNEISNEAYDQLEIKTKIYGLGDKFYKYSYEFYGTPEYWWLIAWFNPEKPTDLHCRLGDIIYIPLPLGLALTFATRGT